MDAQRPKVGGDHAYQLSLSERRELVVEAAQRPGLSRLRMVVLPELGDDPVGREDALLVHLREPATWVAVAREFDADHLRQCLERPEREHRAQSAVIPVTRRLTADL